MRYTRPERAWEHKGLGRFFGQRDIDIPGYGGSGIGRGREQPAQRGQGSQYHSQYGDTAFDQLLRGIVGIGSTDPGNVERAMSIAGGPGEAAMLGNALSGGEPWGRGRFEYYPSGNMGRASTFQTDQLFKRAVNWEKTPHPNLMMMHPYWPEKWDDY